MNDDAKRYRPKPGFEVLLPIAARPVHFDGDRPLTYDCIDTAGQAFQVRAEVLAKFWEPDYSQDAQVFTIAG